jgi:serine/threonine protein kinase
MIGVVYLARDISNPIYQLVCIKKMYGEKMAEKNIFPSIRRELKILKKIKNNPGCIRVNDILFDQKSLSLVFPYYINGDLYKYSTPSKCPAKEW